MMWNYQKDRLARLAAANERAAKQAAEERAAAFRKLLSEAQAGDVLPVPQGMTIPQAGKLIAEARPSVEAAGWKPDEIGDELADEPIHDAAHHGQQKNEPAWKQDGGKPRMDLIAPEMLTATANVLAFGAAKYDERNWEKGMSWGRCFGAMMRHMWAWWGGEKADAETGYSHLWHAAACLMFLIAYEERQTGTDDRKIPVDNP